MNNLPVNQIIQGDTLAVLKTLPDGCINTIITSPPYFQLRNYQIEGQIGSEKTVNEYLDKLLAITAELKRVLKQSGVLYWNHGDTYGGSGGYNMNTGLTHSRTGLHQRIDGSKLQMSRNINPKCMMGIPWRLVLKMVDEQDWILRNIIVWSKPNHMPESVKDRFSKSWEPMFMMVKNQDYWFDLDAVRVLHLYPEDVIRRIHQDKQDNIFPFAKDNQDGVQWRRDYDPNEVSSNPYYDKQNNPHKMRTKFSYRVRDALKKGGQCAGFKASAEEIKRYQENRGDDTHEFNPAGKNPGDVWTIPTQPFPKWVSNLPHFAVFPEELCKQPILSSCPEWVCSKCGYIRTRIIEAPHKGATKHGGGREELGIDGGFGANIYEGKTIGWSKCACGVEFQGGIVLDPFAGSGTACVVAKKLHRRYLGIELNPKYVELARKRLEMTLVNQELFTAD